MDDPGNPTQERPALDPEVCHHARVSRDPRFDGEFFLGVRTTGIYCRPVCPARMAAEKNVRYFRSAAQAAGAGFRPCLRCRPESAPGSPAWNGTSTTVQRALQLIHAGALNGQPLTTLADRLGIGERYLRKLFQRELGVSPQVVALNQRLLFASKLLAETAMPVTAVAFAAGYGSVRRFNAAIQAQFRLPPTALRRRQRLDQADAGIQLQLQYRPPYDWDGVIHFFARHAITGVESVEGDCYQRHVAHDGQRCSFSVRPLHGKHALQLELQVGDLRQLMSLVARVRRMFDLDANPAAIGAVLGADVALAPLLDATPGIRAPGYGSLWEAAVRGIVGQQVSTQAARGVLGRLAAACAADSEVGYFPRAATLAALDAGQFPMPGKRRETLYSLCQQYCGREEDIELDRLGELKGIGPWTVAMVAMRGAGEPDSFPRKDLGLERAWAQLGQPANTLYQHAQYWRPFGSYAANLLWRSLAA